MAKRTTEELAQQLADMKWGDSLSDLEMGANEARALGRAFVALRQQLEELKPEQDEGWLKCDGRKSPVTARTEVYVKFRDGTCSADPLTACNYEWEHYGFQNDIIAYRVVV